MADGMFIYRRHLKTCGRAGNHRCACPVWIDGARDGKRYRRSLRTRDWSAATAKLAALERGEALEEKPVAEAYRQWLAGLTVAESTREKYCRAVEGFIGVLAGRGVKYLSALRVEDVEAWRDWRQAPRVVGTGEDAIELPGLSRGTLARELQAIRLWLTMGQRRRWLNWNPAEFVQVRQARGRQVQPFEPAEVIAMVEAAGRIGRAAYERQRARALVLLLRYTALRIGDAVRLERARVRQGTQGWELLARTEKAGTVVWLPIPEELGEALATLPRPKGLAEGAEARWFFWNGVSKPKTLKNDFDRTLRRVFRAAGVLGAHAHRFRHTLAVQLLKAGATLEDVARVLGNSPRVVALHYAPWCQALQERTRGLMLAIHAADQDLVQGRYTASKATVTNWKQ